jgi:hypothetical protein
VAVQIVKIEPASQGSETIKLAEDRRSSIYQCSALTELAPEERNRPLIQRDLGLDPEQFALLVDQLASRLGRETWTAGGEKDGQP